MTLTVQCSGCKEHTQLPKPVSQVIVCATCGRGLRVRVRREEFAYVVTLAPLEPPTEDDQAKSSGALKAGWQ